MKRKIILSSIILIMTLIISNASFAAVEIVPSKNGLGTDAIVNTTVSNSYLLCQGMKDTGGTLKGTTVKPHLATNKDWGAVTYLSNSIYGTNTQGGDRGVTVTINGVNYYSTTTNITGVMNWGSNPNTKRVTQTAGLTSNYTSASTNSYITELYNNRETEYVEFISPSSASLTKGMAMQETKSYETAGWDTIYCISIRHGLKSGDWVSHMSYNQNAGTGNENNIATFRPVVWN